MPRAEQKALAFVSLVVLLGAAVRVVRAGSASPPTPEEQQAVARQAAAVDSATAVANAKKGGKRAKLTRNRHDTVVKTIGGVSSVPFADVRPGSPSLTPNGFPPPWARIDRGEPADPRPPKADSRAPRAETRQPRAALIDVDAATAAQLERLPRIGPATAARIVANRDSLGPFGSLEGLRRVKGLGPALLRELAPLVTFSGRPASF